MRSAVKKFIGAVCLVVLLASMTVVYAGPAGILVKDGQVSGCIVIPGGTEKGRVLTAAEDMVSYIRQMSGAKIPLLRETEDCTGFRVFIGSTGLAPVGPA